MSSLAVWVEPEAGKAALVEAVGELGLTLKFGKRIAKSALAWLPTLAGKPVPSTPLLVDGPLEEGPYAIAPHTVTVLPLSARHAIDFVAACVGKRMVRPGLLIGEDLIYWASALRFAADLVMRGQFLPGVARDESSYSAHWLAVYDSAQLDALAKAMPPAARALTWKDAAAPPDTPAETVLAGFVQSIVDTLVCASAASRPQITDSLHDQWLNALTAEPAMFGDEPQMAQFARQVEEWQRPVRSAAAMPFRLCFRLQEPGPEEDPWQVEYLLQSRKDPSLRLPANEVWKAEIQGHRESSRTPEPCVSICWYRSGRRPGSAPKSAAA